MATPNWNNNDFDQNENYDFNPNYRNKYWDDRYDRLKCDYRHWQCL
jgi:hypothetical protein